MDFSISIWVQRYWLTHENFKAGKHELLIQKGLITLWDLHKDPDQILHEDQKPLIMNETEMSKMTFDTLTNWHLSIQVSREQKTLEEMK